MKKKRMYVSIGVAFIILITTVSSVVAYQATHTQPQEQGLASPLFTMRTARSLGQSQETMSVSYLGKGQISNLFVNQRPQFQTLVEKAMRVFQSQPIIVEQALRTALRSSQVQQTLQLKGITEQDVLQYFKQVQNNPELLLEHFSSLQIPFTDPVPHPLSLNSTNPFACIITYIVLLPVFLIIGLIIATVTIVTCLNINDCFTNIMENFLQGLNRPGNTNIFN